MSTAEWQEERDTGEPSKKGRKQQESRKGRGGSQGCSERRQLQNPFTYHCVSKQYRTLKHMLELKVTQKGRLHVEASLPTRQHIYCCEDWLKCSPEEFCSALHPVYHPADSEGLQSLGHNHKYTFWHGAPQGEENRSHLSRLWGPHSQTSEIILLHLIHFRAAGALERGLNGVAQGLKAMMKRVWTSCGFQLPY